MTPDILNSISTARYNRSAHLGRIVNMATATVAGHVFGRRQGPSRPAGSTPAGPRA